MPSAKIKIRGARQHNLKNIDLDLPRQQFVVITGLSGSGKSTLAFDTLYAEGQRRYVESLSAYARQFLARMDKPDIDLIDGLSPAIAIEQKSASHNPRSTVGTVTEIYDYLRLLFSRIGDVHCPTCGCPIQTQTVDQMVETVLELPPDSRLIIFSPLVKDAAGDHRGLLKRLRREGFARVRVDGQMLLIEDCGPLARKKPHSIEAVIDRIIIKPGIVNRLSDSLELALALSDGHATIEIADKVNGVSVQRFSFSEKPVCLSCGRTVAKLSPASFSFNAPQGACPACDGLGTTTDLDPDLLIPNPHLSLRQGAVSVWANRNSVYFLEFLEALTGQFKADIYTPFAELNDQFKKILFYGSGDTPIRFFIDRENGRQLFDKPWEGLIPQLQRRYQETDSRQVREEIRQYMSFHPCPMCKGARLKPEPLAVKIAKQSIDQVCHLSLDNALKFFQSLQLSGQKALIAEKIVSQIVSRLEFLKDVGLPYLSLDRPAYSLSGGESQRIRLATQIGSRLTGVLYVLDEPSIGLHQRDNQRLLRTLIKMRDLGNTVLVVEHDVDTIQAADFVVDMGPGAGMKGGQVVFAGLPADLAGCPSSLTGQYMSGNKKIHQPAKRRTGNGHTLTIRGARHNNLKNITATFPLGCFICVTGVSGSGKSSLILETLHKALRQQLYHHRERAGQYDAIEGMSHIDKIINIDQTPIGRTPRSNPGTYTGLFNFIRDLFSKTAESRMRGYKAGRFSFNIKGGRCEACRGDGIVKIEMHFLPDVYVPCDICHGRRYNRETLEVRYKGKNIAEVLDMTVNQALAFFSTIAQIRIKLQTLAEVGLGYIKLGQPATTLSGGEAQRVKLARELAKKGKGHTLYVLDEPTTGLHMEDINQLLYVLNRLVDAGHTVMVIEHHLDVIKSADYVIDLGPEGGDQGGYLVGSGTPETIAALPESFTGQYLAQLLAPASLIDTPGVDAPSDR